MEHYEIADEPASVWHTLASGFQLLTSPVTAASRARYTSVAFANDQILNMLCDEFTTLTRDPAFLTTIVFENSADLTPSSHTHPAWPGDLLVGDAAAQGHQPDTTRIETEINTGEIALNWYLTAAERAAILHAIPEQHPDFTESEADRKKRFKFKASGGRTAELQKLEAQADALYRLRCQRITEMENKARDLHGKRRIYAFRQIVAARNYDRLIRLHEWWLRDKQG
jgi:hypothetical protein